MATVGVKRLTDHIHTRTPHRQAQGSYHCTSATVPCVVPTQNWYKKLTRCVYNCWTGHTSVCCVWCQAVNMEVTGSCSQQQTSRQSPRLRDWLVGETLQKRAGVSQRIHNASSCFSVSVCFIKHSIYTLYLGVWTDNALKYYFDWNFCITFVFCIASDIHFKYRNVNNVDIH